MRKVDELFARYGESHRNPANKAILWICVPLITWSLIGMLWWVTPSAAYLLIGPLWLLAFADRRLGIAY